MPTRQQSTVSVEEKQKDKKYQRIFEDPNQLTPYQGTRRTFGFFYCITCKSEWASANTWANMGQDCFTCMKNTYPYRQIPHKKGHAVNNSKPHPESHCEMCKFLNEPCKRKFVINKKVEENGGEKKSKKKNRSRRNKKAPVVNEE